ncbi:MAG: tRNA dihydrouridine synthase DusB [Candidatus Obscuribacterales bacterium]|nr:tRNA dihydrouridine synthase DusB [Candidatus Obscuribacterales bacterium]
MAVRIGSFELKSRVYVPPMAGVTDIVFRNIVRQVDPNCLLSTEMVSSRGLMYRKDCHIMDLAPDEHPIGIQIFGHEPDVMVQAAQMAEARGADFVDINMGCPVPKITKGKDGCALMKEPELAREIISSMVQSVNIPVTVKFRLGWDDTSRNAVEFGEMVQEAGASLVTVHGRTRQQLYSGKADWSFIAKVKKALSIPVFGNGDVFEAEDALRLLEITGCDGVAVARGTLGNPWLIPRITKFLDTGIMDEAPNDVERLVVAFKHCVGLVIYKGLRVGTSESRRHLTHYTKGIIGGAAFRARLTQISTVEDAMDVIADLAEHCAGPSGRESFLLAVEDTYLEYCKHPSEGTRNSKNGVHTPININPVAPVAKP